jgi:electron-transferring-flavoprotein dehydrogenase
MAISGEYSMPRLAFAGGMLVGDSAQMTNAARFKGIHLGMKSGMCAAEVIAQALAEDDFSEASLGRYEQGLMASWAGRELHRTRHFHHILAHGFNPGAAVKLGISLGTRGWLPGEPFRTGPDAAQTATIQAYYGRAVRREDLDPGIKFDGQPCITKLDDVYASGAMHDEHQPGHLKIVKGDHVCADCWDTKGSPCTAFCPAQVYEMHPDAEGRVARLSIAFSNCLHCKTCEIKCPEGNLAWTPPEGGGGPKYMFC